jgi:hypothetical protein
MKQIQIVTDPVVEGTVQLTEIQLLELINKDGLVSVLQSYELPEEFILKWGPGNSEFDGLPKSIIMSQCCLSENFIKKALETRYLDLEDIYELNMKTYSKLSSEFIDLYDEFINWERMILYLCSSEQVDNIEKYEWIIDKFNLWKLISANNLPIEFIRKHKDKLDWRIVSIISEFSDEEKQEFVEEIPNFESEWEEFNQKENEKIFGKDLSNLSTKSIRHMISEISEKYDREVEIKHTVDNATKEDIEKIKQSIQNGDLGW